MKIWVNLWTFFCVVLVGLGSSSVARAETLPEKRPALLGTGPKSLVNLIKADELFRRGQRDAWVMFECSVAGDGNVYGSDFFTASPDSNLLKNEVRRRLRQTKFVPAVYNHKRTHAWFAGTVLFVVKDGRPHVRVYAHQDLDEIRRGVDFVAPQLIWVPNHYITDFPRYPSRARSQEVGGIVRLRHSVDVNGKTTAVQVISERPPGFGFGEYLTKVVPLLDFLPGYRNGQPTASTYTLTWWFGRPVGW